MFYDYDCVLTYITKINYSIITVPIDNSHFRYIQLRISAGPFNDHIIEGRPVLQLKSYVPHKFIKDMHFSS
jgi:hypothetical protein